MSDRFISEQITSLPPYWLKESIASFLHEDAADHDITTLGTVADELIITAEIQSVEDMVFAGGPVLEAGFCEECKVTLLVEDGDHIKNGDVIARIVGSAREILSRERVLLNLIQRMSGIASKTNSYVELMAGSGIDVIDTRKTIPGMRLYDKYAVHVGGGRNHRHDLGAAMLIKDNHIALIEDLKTIVAKFRKKYPGKVVELEVENKSQLMAGLECNMDAYMLDNMPPPQAAKMAKIIREHPNGKDAYIEVSGGIRSTTIATYVGAGIDGISVGALTHSVRSKDIRLEIVK